MKQIVRIVAISMVMILMSSSFVLAAEKTIKREYTFICETPEFAYEPEQTIKEDGKSYTLKGIRYQEISAEDLYVSKEVTYTNLAQKQVPLKKAFTINGKPVTLWAREHDINYTEQVKTATETQTGVTAEPNFPKSKQIQEGENRYSAVLIGTKETKTTKPFTATVKFTGEQGADFYFNGNKIVLNGNTPTWNGYESSVLKSLKLEEGSQIAGASWNGAWHQEQGQRVRYATFTGTRPASNYTATYQYVRYGAKVTYDNGEKPGAKRYTVKVICTYEKDGLSLIQKVIYAGIGVLLLAGMIVLILYIISKKRKEA